MQRFLFIDLRNTVRSQMAEAWFNRYAEGWARAQSCGTMPATVIDPITVRVMSEAGIEIANALPKPVNTILLASADVVVMMGKDVYPGAFRPDYVWDFQDPTGREVFHYRIQRDAIQRQVQELVVEQERLRYNSARTDWIQPAMLERELMTRQMLGV